MAGELNEEDDVIASINMVPFIDVSLVLLIIFLVTSTYIVQQSIDVELPEAASGQETAPSTVAITVTRNGELAFNGDKVSGEELVVRMREEVEKNPEVQAMIAADRGVDYGKVMDVIDIVKSEGIASFALNVESESSE